MRACPDQGSDAVDTAHDEGGKDRLAVSKLCNATPSCRRLFWHADRRAASRAACTAGRSRLTSVPIIAMTTSSSTSVKAVLEAARRCGKASRTVLKRCFFMGKGPFPEICAQEAKLRLSLNARIHHNVGSGGLPVFFQKTMESRGFKKNCSEVREDEIPPIPIHSKSGRKADFRTLACKTDT